MRRNARRALGLAVLLCLPPAARAAGLAVTATAPTSAIDIDGRVDEPAWRDAGVIADLTQQDPEPGAPTPFSTRILVLADAGNLYLAFECADPDPAKISVHTLARDGDLEGDDTLAFVLDTFGDRRSAFYFRFNAAGARQDGLVANTSEPALDWDGIWELRTARTATGWSAEVRLPAQTLRFSPALPEWGFNVERYVARGRMRLRWAGASRDASFLDLARAGALGGLSRLRQGRGISVSPFLAGHRTESPGAAARTKGDAGVDATWNVTPQLASILTVRTDFAETEVDSRQVNLTRFPLFFPEKRSFFLEGANLFEFAAGLGEDFVPFFSRRIGLFRGREVPVDYGAKVLGQLGPVGVAALGVKTGEDGGPPATDLYAGRITYDATPRLRIGTIATSGDPGGVRRNSLGGFDVVWRRADFRGDKNLQASAWATRSAGDLAPGGRDAWGVRLAYPNDLWDLSVEVRNFGSAVDPALGFLPRPGTRRYDLGGAFQPRPRGGAFGWVRQFFFETFFTRVDRIEGGTESWELFMAPWNVRTRSGEHLEANWVPTFERVVEPFEIASGVVVPAGHYRFDRYRVEAQSSSSRRWGAGSTVWFGDFFGGRLTQWESYLNWTSGRGRLRFELSAENDYGHLPGGNFVVRLLQSKGVWAWTPDLSLTSFLQYDSESRSLGANTRLRWTPRPGCDLFLVWNRNWERPLGTGFSLDRRGDQLTAKLRWTLRH